MRTAGPIVILVIATLAGAARAETPKPYTSKALGFTATFPYPVNEQREGEGGGGTAAAVDPNGVMYMVGVTPARPEVAKTKTVEEQLDDGLQGTLERVKGTLVSQKDIKLGKIPGREVEIELQGGHATFRAYIVPPRTYIIGVVHKEGATLPMPAADFFRSFRLTRKK